MNRWVGRLLMAVAPGSMMLAAPAEAVISQIASPITWQRDTDVNRLLIGQLSGWVNSTSDYQVGATFAIRLISNSHNATTNIDSWQFRLYLNPFAYDDPTRTGSISYRMSAFGFDVNNGASDPDILTSGGAVVNNAGIRSNDGSTANNGNIGFAGVRQGGSFPTVRNNLDVCLLTDASPANCGSGGNAGMSPGEYLSGMIFTLNFTGKLARVVLDNFTTRVNAVAGSFGASGVTLIGVCDRDPTAQYKPVNCTSQPRTQFDPNPIAVPEPAVWGQLIAGFGLTGALLRRRRRLAA